jgi:glucose-1-phosphate thymidylyltransferase
MSTVTTKSLLPVYDKPMIYYPLSTLMGAGVRDILLISTPTDTPILERVLGSEKFGVKFTYAVQPEPRGIAEAFIIGRDFIGENPCLMILGDNIFYGGDLYQKIQNGMGNQAAIFTYEVTDPERYGVVEYDFDGRPIGIVEKPKKFISSHAVTGLYYYNNTTHEHVSDIASGLQPSKRGELEVTDINDILLKRGQLKVVSMGRGYAWLDTGTPDSLAQASQFLHALESRQTLKVGCPEEVALRKGFITQEQFSEYLEVYPNSPYTGYLSRVYKSHGVRR